MGKLGAVVIDPRRHDAVLFDADSALGSTLATQLREIGVGTAVISADGPVQAADRLRCAPAAASWSPGTRRASRPRAPPGSRW